MANSKHEVTIKVQGDSSDKVQPSQTQSPRPTNTQSEMSKEMHARAKELVEQSKDESGKPSMTYHQALSQSGKSLHQEYMEARQAPVEDESTSALTALSSPEQIDVEPVEIDPDQLMPSLAEMGKIWATVFEQISEFGGKIQEEHLAKAKDMTNEFYAGAKGTKTGYVEDVKRSDDDDDIIEGEIVGEDGEDDSTGDLIKSAGQDIAADMAGIHIPKMSSKFDTDTGGHLKAMGQASVSALGSTSGASSAGDALSFFGGMARAGAGIARDVPARIAGQSARNAKMAVGYFTGGAVQPTSSEEEGGGGGGGGGGMLGGLLGGGGDDGGGGGGNPINAMTGDLIDEVFSAPLKPMDMFIETMEKGFEIFMQLNAAVEEAYNEIMGFSGAMIEARVNTELELMEKRMGRAQRMGEQFADYEDSRRDLLSSFEDTKEILARIIVPIVTFIMNIVAVIAKFINMILALIMVIIEAIYYVIEALLDLLMIPAILDGIGSAFDWVTGWLLGSDDEKTDSMWDNIAQWVGDPRGALAVGNAGGNPWAAQ